jgi:hypothetical protein
MYGNAVLGGESVELDHAPWSGFVGIFGVEFVKNSLSFAVVRNPREKIISEYNYAKGRRYFRIGGRNQSFGDFLRNSEKALKAPHAFSHFQLSHYLPQSFYLKDHNISIPYVFPFEEISTVASALCEALGVDAREDTKMNQGAPTFDMGRADRKKIRSLYGEDWDHWESAQAWRSAEIREVVLSHF